MKRRFGLFAAAAGVLAALAVTIGLASGGTGPSTSHEATVPPLVAPATITPGAMSTLAPPGGAERATVSRIIDGDTVEVAMLSGETEIVRLIGINTAESGECFSGEASVALGALLREEVISMTIDTSDRDQYGRLLRYLWLDRGVFVNEIMVRGGYAQAREYPPDFMYADDIATAQRSARADGIGLWAEDACGPSTDADLRVIDVLADPPGSDRDDLVGEWVDIVNAGLVDISTQGWVLKDESSRNRYRFPDGFVIGPQATVRVRTGCGSDGPVTLYWCNGSPVWNNTGDTAFLLDMLGNIVSFYEY